VQIGEIKTYTNYQIETRNEEVCSTSVG